MSFAHEVTSKEHNYEDIFMRCEPVSDNLSERLMSKIAASFLFYISPSEKRQISDNGRPNISLEAKGRNVKV